MTGHTLSCFTGIMSFIQLFIRDHQSPFSVKEQVLIRFRQDLEQCSDNQKIRVIILIMLYNPSISNETNNVCKAYYNMNRSFFLCNWRSKIRKIEDNQYSYLYYRDISYQIRELFMQIIPSQRKRMIHQLLLISPNSIINKLTSIYMYYMWMMFNIDELNIMHYYGISCVITYCSEFI